MKKKLFVFFLLFSFPLHVFAYSNRLIVGGEPIGIEIHSKGVYVVDFYKINDTYPGKDEGFKKGDIILEVNGENINSIDELNRYISDEGDYSAVVYRNGKKINLMIHSFQNNNNIETGLYVKDVINGLGTLSYIDPTTSVFASLGHEILESNSNRKFRMSDGLIYEVRLNYIHKSKDGNIGELHANFMNHVRGNISKNELNGIYGIYTDTLSDFEEIDIGLENEINLGEAFIRYSFDDTPKNYSIDILDINNQEEVKNIFFEITDSDLLSKTGGIVQGMSGAPILQNNKLVGVVNYVVINDSKKGYGVFIEKMLKEGDKLVS
ncbi:MAG: PDZ domain-containing protein [Bacilli bacterium]|nr:PDZ domain-containing protein [Bacilli bacterium]